MTLIEENVAGKTAAAGFVPKKSGVKGLFFFDINGDQIERPSVSDVFVVVSIVSEDEHPFTGTVEGKCVQAVTSEHRIEYPFEKNAIFVACDPKILKPCRIRRNAEIPPDVYEMLYDGDSIVFECEFENGKRLWASKSQLCPVEQYEKFGIE